jgi:type VI protein secretion system component VasF
MLGFRGDYRDQPSELSGWVERARPQIIRGYGEEPGQPDKSEPVNYVPLLTGRERFASMFRWWGIALFALLFVLMVLLVMRLR